MYCTNATFPGFLLPLPSFLLPHLPRACFGQIGSPLNKVRSCKGTELVADLEGRGRGRKGGKVCDIADGRREEREKKRKDGG